MNTKVIIFAVHKEKGIEFLDKLIGDIKYKEIKNIRKNIFDYFVELNDGTTYQVVNASDNARGYKCDKAYVESCTNKDIVDNVIMRCLLSWDQSDIDYY